MAKNKQDKQKDMGPPDLSELATTRDGRDITRPFTGKLEQYRDEIIVHKGGGALKVFTEVLQDDQVKSTFEQRVKAVISRTLTVSPGGDTPIDREAADWLAAELKRIGYDKAAARMLYGTFYGYAVAEMLWAIEGGKVCIKAIKVRDRERFRFDVDRRLRLLTLTEPMDGELQPDRKYWIYTAGASHDDEPYGMGLGHWLYWPVFFKRGGMRLWLRFLDKFSAPTKVGKYHPGASKGDVDKLLAALRLMEVDSAVAIPDGMTIELLEAAKAGKGDYDNLHERMDKAIAKVVLSQTMTTDDGSSQSQATVHEGVRDDVAEGDGDLLCCSFMEGPAKWLTEWNFPGAATPIVAFMHEDEEDLNTAAERDVKLKQLGWELTDEAFAKKYGDGYQRVKNPGTDTEAAGNADGTSSGNEESAFADPVDPDVLDALAVPGLENAGDAFTAEMLQPVLALADQVEDFSEFAEKLPLLMQEAEPDTIDRMTEVFFMARAAGLTGLDEEEEGTPDGT